MKSLKSDSGSVTSVTSVLTESTGSSKSSNRSQTGSVTGSSNSQTLKRMSSTSGTVRGSRASRSSYTSTASGSYGPSVPIKSAESELAPTVITSKNMSGNPSQTGSHHNSDRDHEMQKVEEMKEPDLRNIRESRQKSQNATSVQGKLGISDHSEKEDHAPRISIRDAIQSAKLSVSEEEHKSRRASIRDVIRSAKMSIVSGMKDEPESRLSRMSRISRKISDEIWERDQVAHLEQGHGSNMNESVTEIESDQPETVNDVNQNVTRISSSLPKSALTDSEGVPVDPSVKIVKHVAQKQKSVVNVADHGHAMDAVGNILNPEVKIIKWKKHSKKVDLYHVLRKSGKLHAPNRVAPNRVKQSDALKVQNRVKPKKESKIHEAVHGVSTFPVGRWVSLSRLYGQNLTRSDVASLRMKHYRKNEANMDNNDKKVSKLKRETVIYDAESYKSKEPSIRDVIKNTKLDKESEKMQMKEESMQSTYSSGSYTNSSYSSGSYTNSRTRSYTATQTGSYTDTRSNYSN